MTEVSGELIGIYRWPVKSMAGETLDAAWVGSRGLAGDRAHALFDMHRGRARRLTAREVPRLLDWRARYPYHPAEHVLPTPVVTTPWGQDFSWDDSDLPEVLSGDLGRTVSPVRDEGLQQDLPDSILVTTAASHQDVQQAIGMLSLDRWRTNLHLDIGPTPFAEMGWEGRRLLVGSVEFALLHPCKRCVIPTRNPGTDAKPSRWPELLRWLARERGQIFGINARPLTAGEIRTADPVLIE
jgi:uncharacterized protein YcbX